MASIYSLYDDVARHGTLDADYYDKMIHPVPTAKVVDRTTYLINAAKDKVIFDLGASGPIVSALQQAAREYHGADAVTNPDIKNFYQIDFDRAERLPHIPGLQIIIAGEIVEHLSNAGHFLDLIHATGVPAIVTVPNAGGINQQQLKTMQIESVNKDHVAWYSYHTLKVLVERHQFRLLEWFWYNGQPFTAEGLIFKMEPIYGDN